MLKVTVLIPTRYNNGVSIQLPIIDKALDNLTALCGGYTNERFVVGTYVMDSGEIAQDTCIKVWVVIETTAKLNELREWAANLCCACQQESIYFEHHETCVEFIRAS